MTELRSDRNEFRYEIRCVIRYVITELRNDVELIVIEFWGGLLIRIVTYN